MEQGSGKTVLVVDDDENLRTLTVKLIGKRRHRVLVASSGVEALDICKKEGAPDLVVLDVVMPGMDGYETLSKMRELGLTGVPVVMLTARSGDDDLMAGYQAGVDYYLTKPFGPAALLNVVDFLIGDLSPEEKAKLEAVI